MRDTTAQQNGGLKSQNDFLRKENAALKQRLADIGDSDLIALARRNRFLLWVLICLQVVFYVTLITIYCARRYG
jgi:hypothetical protein